MADVKKISDKIQPTKMGAKHICSDKIETILKGCSSNRKSHYSVWASSNKFDMLIDSPFDKWTIIISESQLNQDAWLKLLTSSKQTKKGKNIGHAL